MNSTSLPKAIRAANGAWQYQVEAKLLGRELDGESTNVNGGSSTTHGVPP